MMNGISNFEWKRMKNLVNCQQLLFTRTEWHSKFGSNLCEIRWEKHHRAFVKVVEDSEIYNFPIHHLVHFSSKLGEKLGQSDLSWNNRAGTDRRRDVAAHRAPPPRCPSPVRAFSRPCAFPRSCTHRGTSKSFLPRAVFPSPVGCTVMPTGPSRAPCSRAYRGRYTTTWFPPLTPKQAGHRL
jgi:hypothetical protein